MNFMSLLAQATPEASTDAVSIIRIVAGALALVLLVVIIVRRKKKASKQDWS